MNRFMELKIDWSILNKERETIYGFSILSIMIFHYFENCLQYQIGGGVC